MLGSYIIMVFISTFSVKINSGDYKFQDTFDALLLKNDSPVEFLVYFGGFIVLISLIFLIINYFAGKNAEEIK